MRQSRLFGLSVASFVLTIAAAYGIAACGGGALESCPSSGIVCTNCAASGDCNIQCAADEFSFCGNFGFFEDPGARCAFCDSRADPFASRVPVEP
ncbi:MAG: hypothetical protein OER21_14055 [Gemmatimonadota bacterium]|nr:hypothetical protein [Gemmatimonadota bacterium]